MESMTRSLIDDNPFASGDAWKRGRFTLQKSQRRNWLVQVEAPSFHQDGRSVNVASMMTITVLGVECAQLIVEILTKI